MREVRVNLGRRSYPVQIGRGGDVTRAVEGLGKDWVLIYDAVFERLSDGETLASVRKALGQLGVVRGYAVPSGEKSKSLSFYSHLVEKILHEGITRQTVVVALGGGVVGDLAGFVAASLLRGLRFVQIPTTLLAQVDSSVGGKVAINARVGKNLIGAFHQPQRVWVDLDFLSTLPRREFSAGMAEILKVALLADGRFWCWLQESAAAIIQREADVLTEMIARAVQIKAEIVAADEQETSGRRALLNLGHTFAHALEAAVKYDSERLLHGEAVAIGMVMAARLSMQQGMIGKSDVESLMTTLQEFSLPVELSRNVLQITAAEVCSLMQFDKKNTQEGLQLILLQELGTAVMCAAPEADLLYRAIAPSVEQGSI